VSGRSRRETFLLFECAVVRIERWLSIETKAPNEKADQRARG
jgi:hypothetical protein